MIVCVCVYIYIYIYIYIYTHIYTLIYISFSQQGGRLLNLPLGSGVE